VSVLLKMSKGHAELDQYDATGESSKQFTPVEKRTAPAQKFQPVRTSVPALIFLSGYTIRIIPQIFLKIVLKCHCSAHFSAALGWPGLMLSVAIDGMPATRQGGVSLHPDRRHCPSPARTCNAKK
jgi:hypothetical protein